LSNIFEDWFKSRENEWKIRGVFIDKTTLATHAHQYHIEISSEYGLGRISLYESNGLYWVDFEAGKYDHDVMFFKSNISFFGEESINLQEKEFIQYMLQYDVSPT
jgi:hypothetical protein